MKNVMPVNVKQHIHAQASVGEMDKKTMRDEQVRIELNHARQRAAVRREIEARHAKK